MSFVVKARTKLELGDAVEFILRYARKNIEDFTFGPMSLQALDDGFFCYGDTASLEAAIRQRFSKIPLEEVE